MEQLQVMNRRFESILKAHNIFLTGINKAPMTYEQGENIYKYYDALYDSLKSLVFLFDADQPHNAKNDHIYRVYLYTLDQLERICGHSEVELIPSRGFELYLGKEFMGYTLVNFFQLLKSRIQEGYEPEYHNS